MPDVVPKTVAEIFTRVLLVENSGTRALPSNAELIPD